MDHGGGFSGTHSPGLGLGVGRDMYWLGPLCLQLLVWQVCTQFLAGDLPQVLAMEVEGVLTGDVPHDGCVGDLGQPLLQLHRLAATVPGVLLQLELHQRAPYVLQGPTVGQALQTVPPQVQMSQRH